MAPRRRGRATRRAAARTPTPEELSDQDKPDAQPSEEETPTHEDEVEEEEGVELDVQIAPGNDDDDDGNEDEGDAPDDEGDAPDDEGDADDAGTPPADEESEASASRAGSPPAMRARGRGRGRGRRGRPRVRPLPADRGSKDESQEGSDTGTPKPRRGGWRARGFGAGRWANRRGGAQRADQLPQDAEGNQIPIENDEALLDDDPEGENKVDKDGNLLGGREYRVRIFTVLGRGDRKYMLSTEPARCIGFRDSYLFFQKHRVLYKIILTDEEKMDLIERDIMPHSYKGRSIGVVTARSVFREFGARIVIRGKNVTDDYYPERARESGLVPGALAVPDDEMPKHGEEYDRNRYVAWHGASAVYHMSGPSVPLQSSKVGEVKKRRVPMNSTNWMFEHAKAASNFNSRLAEMRRANNAGVYNIYTNQIHYPRIMQPTRARWERVPTPPPEEDKNTQENSQASGQANFNAKQPGEDTDDFIMSPPPKEDKNKQAISQANSNAKQPGEDTDDFIMPPPPKQDINDLKQANTQWVIEYTDDFIMPPPSSFVRRNFMVADTIYETPPYSNMTLPGQDGNPWNLNPKSILDISEESIALIPEDCQISLRKAQAAEREWRSRWTSEEQDGRRPGRDGRQGVSVTNQNWLMDNH